MKSQSVDQIFDEIRQLRVQYESEVCRTRKAWPRSIRERVARLAELGIRYKVIGERSGISANTVYTWTSRRGERLLPSATPSVPSSFISLPVSTALPKAVRAERSLQGNLATVTVKIGDRIEVSGLRTSEVLKLLRGLGV